MNGITLGLKYTTVTARNDQNILTILVLLGDCVQDRMVTV